jgi:hypothetical protein
VNNIRETNRGSKGVKLVNLSGKDRLIAISEVVELDEGEDQLSEDEQVVSSVEVIEKNEDGEFIE